MLGREFPNCIVRSNLNVEDRRDTFLDKIIKRLIESESVVDQMETSFIM
jgi:hypothetical protein